MHPNQLGLAPMEGVTDFPMRVWMRLVSEPDFTVTPFLRVTETFPAKDSPTHWAPEILHSGVKAVVSSPTQPQLMAVDTRHFLRAAEPLLKHVPFVELNCGCPAPVVVGKGAGSGLLQDSAYFRKFVHTIAQNLGPQRFAVKMRTGYETASQFDEHLATLAELPLARLVVHGRTRADRYTGKARWDLIAMADASLPFPVLGSGDVVDGLSYQERLATASALQGVIVGRGALRNPWIFRELREGQAQAISFALLRETLLGFALLTELFTQDPEKLCRFIAERGPLLRFTGSNDEQASHWASFNARLREQLPTNAITPRTLGRLKMLWSFLRSSLPEVFFSPLALRCSSLEQFLEFLDGLNRDYAEPFLTLHWQESYDWIYAGEKKATKPPSCSVVEYCCP